jgi:DNA-directed RNA polymerase subunit E'/Rpb7
MSISSSVELFVPIKFTTSVQLKSNELAPNIEEILYKKLKNSLENMCSKHGYIKKNSIKIIKRSVGKIKIQHFNGNIIFDLHCVAEICNPAQGSIIKCKVNAKNSLGILAEGYYDNVPILQIFVPKISAGIQSEINIDKVNIGYEINIEVCGKKFLLYDKYISIIGKAIKDKGQNIKNIIDDSNDIDDDKNDDTDIDLPIITDDKSDLIGGEETIIDDEELDEDDEDDATRIGGDDEDDEDNDEDDQLGGDDEQFEDFDDEFAEPEIGGDYEFEDYE